MQETQKKDFECKIERRKKIVSANSKVSPRRQKLLLLLGGEAMTIDPAEAKNNLPRGTQITSLICASF